MESYFYWIIVSIALIYISKMPLAWAMFQDKGGYDNHHPREQQSRLTGWGKRALGAHLNSFESFPIFGIGVLVAHNLASPVEWIHGLCLVYTISRILYILFYLFDFSFFRSTVWTIGMLASILLYLPKFGG
jgi:uncharacterized MAPEG superfamily protein